MAPTRPSPPANDFYEKPQRERGRPPKKPPGTPVRELREARGLTLTDLQHLTGIGPAVWSEIERGRKLPEPEHIAALSRALDVPFEQWRIRFILEREVPA